MPADDPLAPQLERRIHQLLVLQDFASTLLEHRSGIDDILWDVTQLAVARLGLEDCVIYLVDPERGDLVQRAAYGPKNPVAREILNPIRIPIGKGIVGSVAAHGRIERIGDTRADPRYIQDDDARLSELAVPIFHDGRVVGVLDSEHSQANFFTEWHRDLFVAIAAMASGRITASQLEQARLELATRDSLTGLVNRGELFRLLQQRLDGAAGPVAVIFLDLDQFGVINDSISHLAGDEALRAVGQRILRHLPPGATAGRFGGDEFAVVLDGDESTARDVAADLLSAVTAVLDEGRVQGLRLGCSVGLAVGRVGDMAADVLHQADLAMFHAKRTGGNRMQAHDSQLASARRREQQIVVDMMRTLERGGGDIFVHLQPIYRLDSRRMAGAEVLARWHHASLGPVSPLEFIAAAERTGHIRDLGRHLFRAAFAHIGRWRRTMDGLVFNVNVSPLQLQHDGFATELLDLLEVASIPPDMLACEITETALLSDEARVGAVLRSLVDAGVKLVLDDFGTGYASLGTLVRHPFAGIKIDRQFVRDLSSTPQSRAILKSVVTLSHDLGMACTAEGVEDPAQLQVLHELGCPLVQGYGLCRPVAPEDFEQRWHESAELER